ncbi:uncharacterized protein L3040_005146 [Drepanopeziza brunnea f. sp. 'multigermtubi']|uniref:uncharacterized protein n=1 Tax=Drepanopeziza brunnea f. sp. 'multigermtubi' TaxID=698441 RepID=UPI002390C2D4|nr:hypothetical protein L3040_005146 [Drepanopeziza brunnea f. sp. 'multigermtubi']
MATSPSAGGDGWLLDNDFEYLHGGVDPGVEQDYDRVIDSIAVEAPEMEHRQWHALVPLGDDNSSGSDNPLPTPCGTQGRESSPNRAMSTQCHILDLPSELIDHVVSFLAPIDLVAVSSTCRLLAEHAKSDLSWLRHVQDNIPGVRLTSPYPCETYQQLYIAHDPHWFLPKYKIWFCDYLLTGKLIIARYDPRRGSIEGYPLAAVRPPPTFVSWEYDDEVLIHEFNPHVRLHLDQPVLRLDALSSESSMASSARTGPAHRYNAEKPMKILEGNQRGVFSNFILTRPVQERNSMQLWPPPNIPARHRVRNTSREAFVGSGHKPQKRAEMSNQAFRIRRWMEMVAGSSTPGMHLGEEIYTYATLDPKLYTPTEEKPYRGIWVGDYSGHGCEFLLMHQPDDPEPFDEASLVQREDETPEEFKTRKFEEKVFRGSIEAIKLTGDPNVPRGEYTFISDDISQAGFIRNATEPRFKGARIVKSRGHIAARMFRNDKYIESQLILVSPDLLAQYWVGFGHISFFQRVDLDRFLSPLNDVE